MSISRILQDNILNDMNKHHKELDNILNIFSYLQYTNDEIIYTDSLCKILLKNKLVNIQGRHLRSYIIKQKNIKIIKKYYSRMS